MATSRFVYQVLLYYALVINTVCYALFVLDKGYSQRGEKRIPEKILFTVALLGGALGGILAMYQFRHKTRHFRFKYGLPALLVLQLILIGYFTGY